jgi:hypothetical protein
MAWESGLVLGGLETLTEAWERGCWYRCLLLLG